uniref:Signal recognition particle receptor subunit beta n=2 Tax=Hirondellea gigas TaxID=1518452 RepID=A0A6A7FR48_9CRUS
MADRSQEAQFKKKERISLVDTYRSIVSYITPDHIFYLQVAVAIVIGFIILYVLTRRVAKRVGRGRNIVLVGGCEAGKTALLYTLTAGTMPLTVTSFKENIASYDTGKKKVKMVDVPGHERVRGTVFDRYKEDARAIVFLLDSATLHTNVRDVAEQLFSVLSDTAVQAACCPVAVLCNKQDLELAKAAPIIERALQKEIDVLRETSVSRLAPISSTLGKSSSINRSPTSVLGVAGKPFSFSDLNRTPVTFLEASVLEDKSLQPLRDWIELVS